MSIMYCIKDWERHYEIGDSKRTDGAMRWIPVRTKVDGLAYVRMTQEPNAAELFAAWNLMLMLAGNQDRAHRGELGRDGEPMTPEDMGLLTRFPPDMFRRALEFFASPRIGWLEMRGTPEPEQQTQSAASDCESPPACPSSLLESPSNLLGCSSKSQQTSGKVLATLQDITEQDRTGQDNTCTMLGQPSTVPQLRLEGQPIDEVLMSFPTVGSGATTWSLCASKVRQYEMSYPGVDIVAECRRALQWCIDNPRHRKTPGGMPSFLNTWLAKTQNQRTSTPARLGAPRYSNPNHRPASTAADHARDDGDGPGGWGKQRPVAEATSP